MASMDSPSYIFSEGEGHRGDIGVAAGGGSTLSFLGRIDASGMQKSFPCIPGPIERLLEAALILRIIASARVGLASAPGSRLLRLNPDLARLLYLQILTLPLT